jgi:NTP pyrophosphatase (non-canonical NTP hydrolase)
MGYMTDGLTFNALREANLARLPEFKNKHGGTAHSKPDGSDWSPAQWLQAVLGELGEYANVRKKFERGDLTADEFKALAADELADVQCYLDILAFQLGVNLGAATMDKWNRISERVGCNIRLDADGWHRVDNGCRAVPPDEPGAFPCARPKGHEGGHFNGGRVWDALSESTDA